jgi:hypothetical protein
MQRPNEASLLQSKKFLAWRSEPNVLVQRERTGRPAGYIRVPDLLHAEQEKHYSVAQVAELWAVSRDLIRDVFKDEPGVLKFERPGTRIKRAYSTLRIPESVLDRVHSRLTER